MSDLKVTGMISHVLDVETGVSKAGKDWAKQSFVIDTNAAYNPLISFSLFGDDKIALLNSYKIGDAVTVSFNLSSREFKGKWYSSVDAWRLEKVEAPQEKEEDDNDDLPFA